MTAAIAVILLTSFLLYKHRLDHPVLFYYGAALEVPQGTAIAILNPFRDRKDEANAEWLIADLRTGKCEQIVRERLSEDPARICPILQGSTKASLIWLDPVNRSNLAPGRRLVYDLPESKSRLFVYFGNSEAGWGVNTASLLR
jgi:hypothetical protein